MDQTILYFLALALYISTWKFADVAGDDQPFISLPILGNVYPDGQFNVTFLIGDPPANFTFDIDTGSDVTWVQCDAPAETATKCGYDQEYDPNRIPLFDGILGLGKGEASILTQLSKMGVTPSVIGHCFSSAGGGYLFIGAVGPVILNWKPILKEADHYLLGLADVVFDGEPTDIKDLQIIFDSGSTYTYLPSLQYEALLDLIEKNLKDLVITTEDESLPICWKADQPFTSVGDAATHFKTLDLNFTDEQIVDFALPPESYLIISDKGNPCLGILNGTDVGLGDKTLIGDISMQDTLVLYDNDKSQVGWVRADCNRLP